MEMMVVNMEEMVEEVVVAGREYEGGRSWPEGESLPALKGE